MKKWLIVCCTAICMAVSALCGYSAGLSDTAIQDTQIAAVTLSQENAIEQFRMERQQLRQMQTAQLNEIIYGGAADENIVELANRKLLELMEWSEKETTLEGVLRLREFKDVVVTVHADSVNVMIRADAITPQQTAVIMELVQRETGISGTNVKIIPLN